MLTEPLRRFLSNSVERIMDDNTYACTSTQYERMEKSTFSTHAAFLRALNQACLTYASNNALELKFLIDDSIQPEEVSNDLSVQQSMNFMRLFISEKPELLDEVKSQVQQLINLSMMTGLIERTKKCLQLQMPFSSKPNEEEKQSLQSFLVQQILQQPYHDSKTQDSETEITIDLSVLIQLADLVNNLQPGHEELSVEMIKNAQSVFSVYPCRQTILTAVSNFFKKDQDAESQVDMLYKAILNQLKQVSSDEHATVPSSLGLNKVSGPNCYLTEEAYMALKESIETKLPATKSNNRHKRSSLFDDDAINDIAKSFVQKLIDMPANKAKGDVIIRHSPVI